MEIYSAIMFDSQTQYMLQYKLVFHNQNSSAQKIKQFCYHRNWSFKNNLDTAKYAFHITRLLYYIEVGDNYIGQYFSIILNTYK